MGCGTEIVAVKARQVFSRRGHPGVEATVTTANGATGIAVVTAGVSSFLAFSVGALIPLLPYLLGATSLWPALVVSFVALFSVGVMVSRITVRSWLFSGTRQLLLGGAAAGITYVVGSWVGAGVG